MEWGPKAGGHFCQRYDSHGFLTQQQKQRSWPTGGAIHPSRSAIFRPTCQAAFPLITHGPIATLKWRLACLATVFMLTECAKRHWREFSVSERLPEVVQGIPFIDGTREKAA